MAIENPPALSACVFGICLLGFGSCLLWFGSCLCIWYMLIRIWVMLIVIWIMLIFRRSEGILWKSAWTKFSSIYVLHTYFDISHAVLEHADFSQSKKPHMPRTCCTWFHVQVDQKILDGLYSSFAMTLRTDWGALGTIRYKPLWAKTISCTKVTILY